jgi:HAMP domain-containing protein
MSLRGRLRLFFLMIVVVPLIVVGAVFYLLIASNESAKSDAQVSAHSDTAIALYEEAFREAQRDARTIARDVPFATAIRRNDIEALQTRAADLRERLRAQRVVVATGGNRALVDVGNASANLPASIDLVDGKRRFGELEVSAITPRQYVERVRRTTGLDALVMREGGDVLATTLPAAARANIPVGKQAFAKIGGRKYRTYAFLERGFLGERVKIAVLSPRPGLSENVRKWRLLAAVLLVGFLLLAITFGLVVSRSLQSQMGSFLEAARRLREGDYATQVPTAGNDEFAALGAEFNAMSVQLQDRLRELNQERGRLKEAMRRIGETFASNLDREALLEIVVRTAVDGVGADAGRASVRPTLTDPLEQVAITGDAQGLKEAIRAVEAKVLETGEPSEAEVDGVSALSHPLRRDEHQARV